MAQPNNKNIYIVSFIPLCFIYYFMFNMFVRLNRTNSTSINAFINY